MSNAGFFSIVGVLLAVAGWLGWYSGREAWCGGWGERKTHTCGWFNEFTIGNWTYGPDRPCPGCGLSDNNWHTRVGRPTFPWGWEWKDG